MTNLTVEERQTAVESIFVDHANHRAATDAIWRQHKPVEGGLHSRGKISALIGESRTGKTFAAKGILRENPPTAGTNGVKHKVLLIECPIEGGSRAVIESVATALGMRTSLRLTNSNLLEAVLRELRRSEVEFVIFDEAQELFPEKNKKVLSFSRKFLRKMLNLDQFSILCIGLPETYQVISEDSQLVGRGGLPYKRLRFYDWTDPEGRKQFRVLCHKFDEEMPFDPSGFAELDYSFRLYKATKGCIGSLKDYMIAASNHALNEGSSQVERDHFASAYDERKRPNETRNSFRGTIE